jgi:hypothetical protein
VKQGKEKHLKRDEYEKIKAGRDARGKRDILSPPVNKKANLTTTASLFYKFSRAGIPG